MKRCLLNIWNSAAHIIGRLSRHYYFEDFIRVYPDGIAYNRLGFRRTAKRFELNNYINHFKFYTFAAQFVRGQVVADIGCGSGYGCAILKQAGAERVSGADLSKPAIAFARNRYGQLAEFTIQGATSLKLFREATFDVTVSSEVLEHVKEYGKEDEAIDEIWRITKPGGVIVIGTPNQELLGDHGFSYEEIDDLMSRHFAKYCIFENALVPTGSSREQWERRMADGRTGVIVTEAINLSETALPEGGQTEIKRGIPAGIHHFQDLDIDTSLLHNTHSWIVVAAKWGA